MEQGRKNVEGGRLLVCAQGREGQRPGRAPLFKQLLLAIVFLALFLVTDGSSTAAQAWEGAPPTYLPTGLALALLLYGGKRCVPLVFLSTLVAASVNYHRPMLSWCGIPGATVILRLRRRSGLAARPMAY